MNISENILYLILNVWLEIIFKEHISIRLLLQTSKFVTNKWDVKYIKIK